METAQKHHINDRDRTLRRSYWDVLDVLGCTVHLSHLLCVSGFGIFEPLEPAPCVSALGLCNGGCHVVPQRVH